MLTEAPKIIVATAYVKAMTAAVRIIEGALWELCPEREENARDEDKIHVRESIMDMIEIDSRFRGAAAAIGFGNMSHVALWLEYGHRMVGHLPNKKQLGTVAPHPFIRRAFDESADAAIAAFANVLESELRNIYG